VGGVRILKTDGKTNKPLKGARFRLIKKSSSDYKADLKKNGYVKRGGKIYEVVSNDKGQVIITGIAYGKSGQSAKAASSAYWLVETKAPKGYKKLKAPLAIVIDGKSFNKGVYKYTIKNTKSLIGIDKQTGDYNDFILWGALLLVAAIAAGTLSRKRQTQTTKGKALRSAVERR
jgi:uncharacterized surface anchored protein